MKKSTGKHEAPPLGELADSIHINVDEIPDYVRDELAAATLEFIRDILRNPDSRAMLEARIEEKKRLTEKVASADHGAKYADP